MTLWPRRPSRSCPERRNPSASLLRRLRSISPNRIDAKAGQPISLRLVNAGTQRHDLYFTRSTCLAWRASRSSLGDEAQAEHEAEMTSMGGMMPHDEENGIAVEPGETKELTDRKRLAPMDDQRHVKQRARIIPFVEQPNAYLTAAWQRAQGNLPPGWSLDRLRCASTGLGVGHRSDDWVAMALGPDGQQREHRAPDRMSALGGLARSFGASPDA